jgi:tRNA pseudouridine55 synthase
VDGVIVVDKPVGPTSFDVVAKIRRALRIKKVGHGGTLDPLASGVLPVCVGEGTKLAPFLLDADKEYEFAVRFGVETDTDDAGGAVTRTADASAVDEGAVGEAMGAFRGAISQVPPAYAAIKRDGKALYAYAREGTPVQVEPRAVTVFELELLQFAGTEQARFRMRCSKGTYVRALARDLGRALGVGAHVTALRRTRSGPFSLASAEPMDQLLAGLGAGAVPRLMSLSAALADYPTVRVDDGLVRRLRAGQPVAWALLGAVPEARVCVLESGGGLVAVAESRPDGLVRTLRVFGVESQKPARKASAVVDEGAIL